MDNTAAAASGYPPVANDDAYKEIFEQAENFKKYQGDVVQHFFTTQLSGFLPFNHIRLILIRAHIAQI